MGKQTYTMLTGEVQAVYITSAAGVKREDLVMVTALAWDFIR